MHTQRKVGGTDVNVLEFLCAGSFSLVVTLQGQLSAQDFNQVLREQTLKAKQNRESLGRRKKKNKKLLRLSLPELQLRNSLLPSQLWAEEWKKLQRPTCIFKLVQVLNVIPGCG